MRIVLSLQYRGTDYSGWQKQPGLITVQETVEQALSKLADQPITVYCAGRTDAGVHAREQVIHFDTNAERSLNAWVQGTNSYLPDTVSVNWARRTDDSFHARFSAVFRRYQYKIYNAPSRSALLSLSTTWHMRALDVEPMKIAAQALLGQHDFQSFRSSDCQAKTSIRHIMELTIDQNGPLIILDIKGNAFLHHMIRNIMGVLLPIGEGKKPAQWAADVLASKNRSVAGVTASPNGLCLYEVGYNAFEEDDK